MNNIEIENFKLVAKKYKNICMGIDNFCDLLKFFSLGPDSDFLFETKREILMTGLYGKLYSTKLWVSKSNTPGYIRVSNEDVSNSNDESKWSAPVILIDADKIEKVFNLKAFW